MSPGSRGKVIANHFTWRDTKGGKLNNVTMTIEIDRKERMPTIEKSP